MAREEGMALCPWGALGGGNFSTKAKQQNNEQGRNFGGPSEKHIKVAEKLETIANAKNTQVTSIALAYVSPNTPSSSQSSEDARSTT
jgi:aryl-alcohol dehydrogenase-like predicted oxidoreductase